jgi:predicted acylesterase/phospholipase RssA
VLSSYFSRRRGSEIHNVAKIWEAARATSAASSFFEPIRIGNEDFVDGATPANNPIQELWTEASDTFKEGDNWRLEDNILCLVSVGTGIPTLRPFGDDPIQVGKSLLAIATDTERRAEEFHRHHPQMASSTDTLGSMSCVGWRMSGLRMHQKRIKSWRQQGNIFRRRLFSMPWRHVLKS